MMKNLLRALFFFIIPALVSSCAASYKPIRPVSVKYPPTQNNFAFKFDVLRDAGNIKLWGKEESNHVRIVAIKFINTSGRTLQYGNDFLIYSGDQKIKVLPPAEICTYLRQSVSSYLFYLGLTPVNFTHQSGNNQYKYPVGFITGIAMAGGNMLVSAKANKHLRAELERNCIVGHQIKDGETFYGLIGIYGYHSKPLAIKMIN